MQQGLGDAALESTCGEGGGGLWVRGGLAAPRVGRDAQEGPNSRAAEFPGGWGPLWHPLSAIAALLRAPLGTDPLQLVPAGQRESRDVRDAAASLPAPAALNGHRGCHPCPPSIPAGGPRGSRR